MNKLLHLMGGRLPQTEAVSSSGSAPRAKAGIWLMLLTLLCVGRSSATVGPTYCTPMPSYQATYMCTHSTQIFIDGFAMAGAYGTSIADYGTDVNCSTYQDRTSVVSAPTVLPGGVHSAT